MEYQRFSYHCPEFVIVKKPKSFPELTVFLAYPHKNSNLFLYLFSWIAWKLKAQKLAIACFSNISITWKLDNTVLLFIFYRFSECKLNNFLFLPWRKLVSIIIGNRAAITYRQVFDCGDKTIIWNLATPASYNSQIFIR